MGDLHGSTHPAVGMRAATGIVDSGKDTLYGDTRIATLIACETRSSNGVLVCCPTWYYTMSRSIMATEECLTRLCAVQEDRLPDRARIWDHCALEWLRSLEPLPIGARGQCVCVVAGRGEDAPGEQGLARDNKVRFPISTCKIAMTILGSPQAEKNGVIDWTDNRTPALGVWFPFPFSPHQQCYSIGTGISCNWRSLARSLLLFSVSVARESIVLSKRVAAPHCARRSIPDSRPDKSL